MLQSETFAVLDCIVYDQATDTSHYSKWRNLSSRLTVTNASDGTLLENSSGSSGYYGIGEPSRISLENYMFDWEYPCVIEFDTVTLSDNGEIYIQLSDEANHNIIRTFSNLGITASSTAHIEINNSTIQISVNGGTPTIITNTLTGKFLIALAINTGHSLKFKNFKIYPI